jgi:protocatechuate 3,4-dioxygenase beta subunit
MTNNRLDMNKRAFLKTAGILGASSLIPFGKILAGCTNDSLNAPQACTLIPSETAGPFPLDLSDNTFYFRKDVRESKPGVQLNLRMKIKGVQNCEPMQNVRVNIWHCDKDGNYSGYDSFSGQTWCRGYQMTDATGEVEFITIFPGWYPGRVCHIHFQVYVNSSYAAISQLAFDEAAKDALYIAHPTIYTKGPDPLEVGQDGVFSDGYQYQLATLTPNTTTGGYDSYLEVTVQGTGAGVGYQEQENAKQFTLQQNYPNPYLESTTIPFSLKKLSDVTLELWSLDGKRLASVDRKALGIGDHTIAIEPKAFGLQPGSFVYQLEVRNDDGIYRGAKMMTGR